MSSFAVARDDASAPFFDAAAAGTLLLRRCPACDRWYPPYQHTCADGTALEWAPGSGTATLVSWAVDHGPVLDPLLATPDASATVLGLIELEEGPWMYASIVGAEPDELRAGARLQVRFVAPGGGEPLPAFTPA